MIQPKHRIYLGICYLKLWKNRGLLVCRHGRSQRVLRRTVTNGAQRPAAEEANFRHEKVLFGGLRSRILLLTAWFCETGTKSS